MSDSNTLSFNEFMRLHKTNNTSIETPEPNNSVVNENDKPIEYNKPITETIIPIKEEVKEPEPVIEETQAIRNFEGYRLYRDKQEDFSCDIMIEGGNKDTTVVRLLIESDEWNLVFSGKYKDGKCYIPIKKLPIFNEGVQGLIKLEVIVEDTVFTPWEQAFIVENSKKVIVKVHEQAHQQIKENKIQVKVFR